MSSYQKRRISEQTYKFPKCIFPFFPSSQYTIYIYFPYDVVQLDSFLFDLPHPHHPYSKHCYVSERWDEAKECAFTRKAEGRLGKAKENQYVSDKKAQILDASSV